MYKFNYNKDMYVSCDREEPGKEIYYKFIEYAVKKCEKFILHIMDFKDEEYNPHECDVMKELQPYLIKSEKTDGSVGTHMEGPNIENYLYYYRCCEEVIAILKSASEGFYNWGRSCPPEDLTFLLENNEVWYRSITHENEFDFYMDKDQYDDFKKEVKGLRLLNRYELQLESMITYFNNPGKDVYNEALKYAENISNYFNLEIFTVAEDINSKDIIEESIRKYKLLDVLSPYKIKSESKLLKKLPVEMVGFPKDELNGVVTFGGYDIKNYDQNFLSKIEGDTIFGTKEDEEEFKEIKILFKDVYHIIIKYQLNEQSMKIIKNAAENMFHWGHKNKMPDVVRFYKDDTENTWLVLCDNDGFKASYVRFEKYGEVAKFGYRTDNRGKWYVLSDF